MKFISLIGLASAVEQRQKLDLESDSMMGKSHHMVVKLEEQMEMLQESAKSGKEISSGLQELIVEMKTVMAQCLNLIGTAHITDVELLRDTQKAVLDCEDRFAVNEDKVLVQKKAIDDYGTGYRDVNSTCFGALSILTRDRASLESNRLKHHTSGLDYETRSESVCCHSYIHHKTSNQYCCEYSTDDTVEENCENVFKEDMPIDAITSYFAQQCGEYDSTDESSFHGLVHNMEEQYKLEADFIDSIATKDEEIRNKKNECETANSNLVIRVCSRVSTKNTGNELYNACRPESAEAFEAEHTKIAAREFVRFNEFKSVEHIKCILENWPETGVLDEIHEGICRQVYDITDQSNEKYAIKERYCNPEINEAHHAIAGTSDDIMHASSDLYDGLMIADKLKSIPDAKIIKDLVVPSYCS